MSFDAQDFQAVPDGTHRMLQLQPDELTALSKGLAEAADLIDSVPQLIESAGFAPALRTRFWTTSTAC